MSDEALRFEGRTVVAARLALHDALSGARLDDTKREARLLLEYATGLTPEQLLLDDARVISATQARRLSEALTRRLAHEPLSRIRGERAFYGRTFEVTPAVLDPRPETELLVEQVLEWADQTGGRDRTLHILDVGTGSGCILVTLLAELPAARGVGTDVSEAALEVARANAGLNGVSARARFEIARSLQSFAETFDVLVSNPPYIPTAEVPLLAPEVRDYDPLAALDGGPDGLAIYREIAARAGTVVPAGLIAVEVGARQSSEVARIFAVSVENRAGPPWTRTDLGGHERTVALLTHR
ncbi:MAG: peptide chain release factor N(5)-glutamine methyltransferase [Hyphomicrobium sp.]|jgi:release factor glutamine methyltransferase|nr:peptide chain release factor N(5)-glutamine methyltransferase [Hyphomicrobium sp.]